MRFQLPVGVTLGITIILAFACRERAAPLTLRIDPTSCRPDAYYLQLPRSGEFVLNGEARDSAGVARWLRVILPRRDRGGNMVNIRAELPDRQHDLEWLATAIASAGGKAYAADPTCRVEMPARSAG